MGYEQLELGYHLGLGLWHGGYVCCQTWRNQYGS